jgi:hypothetical protein
METMEEGWSVSSSERISVPNFTVTVNYQPTGEEQDGIQFETFNLDAYRGETAGMESLLFQQFLPLQDISRFHVERDHRRLSPITRITKDIAGSVCLCDFQGVDDINAVQSLAAIGGAKALFLLRRPSTEPSDQMPVFVMPSEVIHKLVAHINATVTFQWKDGARASRPSSDEEMNDGPTSAEQCWFGQEFTAHGKVVDTNAPIEPPRKASTVTTDLLQMGSSEDNIGQFAACYGEKKAPREVNFR